jgi:hypothetical protein
MRKLLAAVVFVALLPMCSDPLFAETNGPDSGVYGTVPNYQKDLKVVQDYIEFDSDAVKKGNSTYSRILNHDQAILEDWKHRCVEAYYADSAAPDGYSLLHRAGQSGTLTLFGPCVGPAQSQREYVSVAAWTACNPDGSFHLSLSPGKYAVFVGREERYDASGSSPREDLDSAWYHGIRSYQSRRINGRNYLVQMFRHVKATRTARTATPAKQAGLHLVSRSKPRSFPPIRRACTAELGSLAKYVWAPFRV